MDYDKELDDLLRTLSYKPLYENKRTNHKNQFIFKI